MSLKRVVSCCASVLMLIFSASLTAGDETAGQQKSAACTGCHGADGNSQNPAFPKLAGQYEDYLLQAMRAYRKQGQTQQEQVELARDNAIMSSLMESLSDQDLQDLAAYFAAQPGELYVPSPK